jgi:hypothetical protein
VNNFYQSTLDKSSPTHTIKAGNHFTSGVHDEWSRDYGICFAQAAETKIHSVGFWRIFP